MNGAEIINKCMAASGMTPAAVAKTLGYSRQNLYEIMNAKHGSRIDVIEKIINATGHELVVRNKTTLEEIK